MLAAISPNALTLRERALKDQLEEEIERNHQLRSVLRRHRAEIDSLKAELAGRRPEIELTWSRLRLSRTEDSALRCLYGFHGTVSRAGLRKWLEADRALRTTFEECDYNDKYLELIICRLRKKLAPHALPIEGRYGLGWLISDAARDTLTTFK